MNLSHSSRGVLVRFFARGLLRQTGAAGSSAGLTRLLSG
ncbi:hypothetical protein FHS10_005150 [Mucilaginibacter dorajii]|nr:hypothetical protein [Mucilaginibacter dorajii]